MNSIETLIYIYLLSMAPLIEGRYAIIYGVMSRINLFETFLVASIGTLTLSILLPVVIDIIDKIGKSFNESNNTLLKKIGRIYISYLSKLEKRKEIVEKYGFLGLTLFVAVPLPATGMWTGSLLALLLGMRGRKLIYALLFGGLISNNIICCSLYFGRHFI